MTSNLPRRRQLPEGVGVGELHHYGYLTVRQFAKRVPSVSERTIRRMIDDEQIFHVRLGSGRGRIFIPITEIRNIVPAIVARRQSRRSA